MVSGTPHTTSDEWRRALTASENVKRAAGGLQLEPKHAWLRQVLDEAADQMRDAVLWAAQQAVPDRTSREGLRPLIVAADATRSDASLASYFVSFLRHEGLLSDASAAGLAAQLQEVELGMDTLSRSLRTELGFDPYAPAQAGV
jgi:DNA-directed RNA polymerase specialized sigma54-like protein